jgi:hypothetical protein
MRALGVDTLTTQGETVITVVQRLHHRHFVNLEELVAHLQASFPYARVEVAVLDHRTIQEQVAVFSITTVLVAAEGGALDLLVFRHPSLSVVVLGRSPSLPYPVGCLDRSGQCGESDMATVAADITRIHLVFPRPCRLSIHSCTVHRSAPEERYARAAASY